MITKIDFPAAPRKAAIVTFGTRLTLYTAGIRKVGLIYLREYIMNVLGRTQVDYVSKKSGKEAELDYYRDIRDTDLNDYDELWIFHSPFNPFGGVFKESALITFDKMVDYKGDVIYYYGDPKMGPWDFGKFLEYKDRQVGWSNCGDIPCDNPARPKYHIPYERCHEFTDKIFSKMMCAFAGKDMNMLHEKVCTARSRLTYNKWHPDLRWFFCDLHGYEAINEDLDDKLKDGDFNDKEYDLIYFGNNRHSNRLRVIETLYGNTDELHKLFLGYDPQLANTTVMRYVDHDKMFDMMRRSFATVVCGDIAHNDNICTPRYYEAMLCDCVAFIYDKFDSKRAYIKDEVLRDFCYVSTHDELVEKINKIKNDEAFYRDIIRRQREDTLSQLQHLKY